MNGSSGTLSPDGRWLQPFLIVWGTQTASLFGGGMVQFALIWWLASMSGSASLVSLAAAIVLLPRILLNPFIGALVDRCSRRTVMIAAAATIAMCSFFLATLFLAGTVRDWQVLLVLLIRSSADTFHTKAMAASTSLMVPGAQLTRIAGINQALTGIILFVTPALGALLLKISSFVTVMAFDVAGAILAVTPLLFILIPEVRNRLNNTEPPGRIRIAADVAEGVRYLRNWPGALGMLALSAAMNFVMQPYFSLIAISVKNRLHGGELEFGLLGALVGLGFLVGGVTLGIWQGHSRRMVTSLLGMAAAGLSVIATGFAGAQGIAAVLLCFFSAGFAMPFCMGPIQALIQGTVRGDMQGRVFSIMESVSTSASPLSLLAAGRIFDSFGPEIWYWGGGAAAIAVAVYGLLDRRIRNLGAAECSPA